MLVFVKGLSHGKVFWFVSGFGFTVAWKVTDPRQLSPHQTDILLCSGASAPGPLRESRLGFTGARACVLERRDGRGRLHSESVHLCVQVLLTEGAGFFLSLGSSSQKLESAPHPGLLRERAIRTTVPSHPRSCAQHGARVTKLAREAGPASTYAHYKVTLLVGSFNSDFKEGTM